MPLHHLSVTPADVSGARLALALNTAAPQPLATYRLVHPDGGALLLGVLGASHVVTVDTVDQVTFSEQVSCIAGGNHGDSLPEHAEAPGYRLESGTYETDETEFRRLARELRDRCTTESGWLGGVFPGDDAALTALSAAPDAAGWRWQTWHLYPRDPLRTGGTVVHTASRWRP